MQLCILMIFHNYYTNRTVNTMLQTFYPPISHLAFETRRQQTHSESLLHCESQSKSLAGSAPILQVYCYSGASLNDCPALQWIRFTKIFLRLQFFCQLPPNENIITGQAYKIVLKVPVTYVNHSGVCSIQYQYKHYYIGNGSRLPELTGCWHFH